MLQEHNYKTVTIFNGLPRCKKRAQGAGTTSPPVFSFVGGIKL